ncbi:DUF1269 domain-containing protein [Streptomyces sp. NPDC004111]|uniref:DUF1269 domain-containing protein n=1 Tax=Streptomyces sp. NPDC004111 TaxID=3364690 RepID=UPI0036ADED35
MTTETGPIQMLTIAFGPETKFEGRIVEELEELMVTGQILVLDLLVVHKQTDGDLVSVGYQMEGMGETVSALLGLSPGSLRDVEAAVPSLAPGRAFGLDADDVREIADALEPGTTTGFLLLEHRWARKLRRAIREQGGVPVAEGFLTEEVLAPVAAELLAIAAERDAELAEKSVKETERSAKQTKRSAKDTDR